METARVTLPGVRCDRSGQGVVISVSRWLRQQLDCLDDFVASHVVLPWEYQVPNIFSEVLFQPTFCSAALAIKLDPCCMATATVNGEAYERPISDLPQFGPGDYTFRIEAPSVYIGPHKYGKRYSTNLRVTRIHCERETEEKTTSTD